MIPVINTLATVTVKVATATDCILINAAVKETFK